MENKGIQTNVKDLAEALALEECKRVYGDEYETLYKNNYDQFTGYIMRPTVKVTFDKSYNKYYDIIMELINKKQNGNKN